MSPTPDQSDQCIYLLFDSKRIHDTSGRENL